MKKPIIISVSAIALMLGACNSSSNKNEQSNGADTSTTQSANAMQQFNLDTTKSGKMR